MLIYIYQNGYGTNHYNEFVPEEGEAHEMEKMASKQYGTIDVETNMKDHEKASELSASNPFAKQKVQIRLYFRMMFVHHLIKIQYL